MNQNVIVNENVISSVFLTVQSAQSVQITLRFLTPEMSSFQLFGQTSSISVQNCSLNVSIKNQITFGGLICIKCNVLIEQSITTFAANGLNVSGLVVEATQYIEMLNSLVMLRTQAEHAAAIIVQIFESISFQISQCNISAYFFNPQLNNAILSSSCSKTVEISLNKVQICANIENNLGQASKDVTVQGQTSINCILCGSQYISYGLCVDLLINGKIRNDQLECEQPFIFNGSNCICEQGFIINGSQCINLVDKLTGIEDSQQQHTLKLQTINSEINTEKADISNLIANVTSLKSSIIVINNNISSFNSNIETLNTETITHTSQITTLNSQIQTLNSNITNIYRNISLINTEISTVNSEIVAINNNISAINSLISDQQNLIKQMNVTIQHQQNIITNLTAQISCVSNNGFQYTNGLCAKVTCPIPGQQSINGICQCTNINSIIQDNVCICPQNSIVISGVCTCSITGQYVINGSCNCYTSMAARNKYDKNNIGLINQYEFVYYIYIKIIFSFCRMCISVRFLIQNIAK
ncbi:Conserved_hypothetical protein [Hexamita inflata]|uniref:Uncharacterized protein n=1 Tax=Hexamita inflata TaxID=28002 RepID=A0AA86USW2_9EUKA|nr:Conserved hypothetical protein [Hexamita inflata]